ncbi:lytic transglycosylase domain-containing protein [Roseibium litorale]|uniref:lytic transglycosylase domain-containing protein n=1 Tax=Roseibium litorale TaxID=2803841 RepID=UPI003CCD9B1A
MIRVVNAGKAVASASEEDGEGAGKKKSLRRSRGASATSAPAIARSSTNYAELIRAAAKKHGVPLEIAQAVVRIESNFNPRARGSHGEVGLMQIKPATARGLGYRGSTKALYDPKTNLEWGMRYLAGAHQRASGDVCGTILRYNAGHFAKRMNARSRSYCSQVKQLIASS